MLVAMDLRSSTARVPALRALHHVMAKQLGLITHAQAIEVGATDAFIHRRLATGDWIAVHEGVYRHTSAPTSPEQLLLAAVLAGGEQAVASHRSSAWLWGLLAVPPDQPEISVPRRRSARLGDVVVHHPTDLIGRRASLRRGVWTTDPMRTAMDVAGVVPPHVADLVVDRGIANRLFTAAGLIAVLDRSGRRGRPGSGALRRALARRGVSANGRPPSVLESRMARLCRRFGIADPVPEYVPCPEAPYRLDFAWPEVKVAVEVDGYEAHSSYVAFRGGLARKRWLDEHGWIVLHFAWEEIAEDPEAVATQIMRVLANIPSR